jgi:membrane protein
LLAGILFLAGLLTDGLEVFLGKKISVFPDDIKAIFQGAVTQIISAVIYTCWFIMLFRYLADGKPSWFGAIAGGIVTGVLFSAGKLLIKWALLHSNVGTVYGASGSIDTVAPVRILFFLRIVLWCFLHPCFC